mmetsp:Transcript_20390/g.33755  ORF Transcript_20390/g.33755 Transcript_20390/m.33755 type:complete len:231 (+) Transcript_20390:56-748(+)
MSSIDIEISITKAALKSIRAERQNAQREHDTSVVESWTNLSKGDQQIFKVGRRSRQHQYSGAFLVVDSPTVSPYILQKQSILCMSLHNLDIMAHQRTMLEHQHQQLVKSMHKAGEATQDELRRRKDYVMQQLFANAGKLGAVRGAYEKTLTRQHLVISDLQELLGERDTPAINDSSSEIGTKEGTMISYVQGIFDNVQKRNDKLKNRLQDQSLPKFRAVLRRRKVVAEVA